MCVKIKYVFLFFVLITRIGFSQSLSPSSVDKIKKATVFISVKHNFILTNEEITTSGSGFFINEKGWIATNYHVIQSSLSDYGASYPTRIKQIKIFCNSGTQDFKTYNSTIVSFDKENDLAILAISDTVKFPFVEIDSSKLNELTPVWIFGYPFGDQFTVLQRGPEITVNNGSVSALRHDDRNELNRVQVDAVINHGNSGGPVVNDAGKVIGIINSMMGNSRINFGVPAHYLGKMMKKIPISFRASDSTQVKVKVIPDGSVIFVDTVDVTSDLASGKNRFIKNGIHTLVVMKKGYESYMKEIPFLGNLDETVMLQPEKKLVVPAPDKAKAETIPQPMNVTNDSEILFTENFDDSRRFEKWEQSTGGEKTRTWYLEGGRLNQYENNSTLHAIYLGDSKWDNYTLNASVKISDDGGEQGADSRAGIIFRETEDGFYLFRIHKETNKAQLAYHCKHPFGWFVLSEKKLEEDIVSGKWYELSASVHGSNISCSLDGKNLFSTVASFSSGGRVGFYSVESKPIFDSLTVVRIKNISSPVIAQSSSPVSFWFSDNFDLKSVWWHQYKTVNGKEETAPLYMVDGSFSITEESKAPVSMEFTKYLLRDFVMNISATIDDGKEDAVFEIFLRKNENGFLSFRFDKKSNKVFIVLNQSGKEKILKEKKLYSNVFKSAAQLTVRAEGDMVSVGSVYADWIQYDGKNTPLDHGTIGFSAKNVRVGFHSLTLSSISKPPPKEKAKK